MCTNRPLAALIFMLADGGGIAQPAHDTGASDAAVQRTAATGSNPALLYWQAIALLPEFRPTQVQLIEAVVNGTAPATGEEMNAMLERAEKSHARFLRAAVSPEPCSWGTTFDEGPFAPMPHLPKLLLLCRLALARSEALFAQGRHPEALRATLAAHRAARHLAADTLLVTVVMQHSIEQQALRVTARHLLALDDATRASHAQALQQLPALRTVREALGGEHSISQWLRHMERGIQPSPQSEEAVLDVVEALLQAQSQTTDPTAANAAKEALTSLEDWRSAAEQELGLQARLQKATEQPWPAFQAELQQVRRDLAETLPTLRHSLPGIEGAMRKQCETATLHIMLGAALDRGPALSEGALTGYQDAFDGGPLHAARSGDSFVLTAHPAADRKALSLVIAGRRP